MTATITAALLAPKYVDFRSAGAILTPEEFDAIEDYDELYHYELIRGVLVVSPIPSAAERLCNGELGFLLKFHQYHHPQGRILDKTIYNQPIDYGLNRRLADRVVWAGFNRPINSEKDLPTIAIDFVHPRKRNWLRDHEEKRAEYLAIGIREYWVFDRFDRKLIVNRCQPDRDVLTIEEIAIAAAESYHTDLLPGFEFQPQQIFEALNTVADSEDDDD